MHEQQTPIIFDKEICKKMHKPIKCYLTGMCVCKNAPPKNIYSTWIAKRISNAMKKEFWSKGSGKERKTSKARDFLEKTQVVLALRPASGRGAEDNKGLWLHLGFVNYKTWALSTLELLCSKVAPNGQRAWLQLVDILA